MPDPHLEEEKKILKKRRKKEEEEEKGRTRGPKHAQHTDNKCNIQVHTICIYACMITIILHKYNEYILIYILISMVLSL